MTRRRYWPPVYDGDDYDAVLDLDGRELRRYGRTWCGQTRAGGWRSAQWLGLVNAGDLLDRLHIERQSPAARIPSLGSAFNLKPFRYYGGKARLAWQLIEMMPDHKIYVEPFLGSGAVICAKSPAKQEMVNDLDDRLVTFFRVLRDDHERLADALRLTPYSRTEFVDCRANPRPAGADDIEIARRFFVGVSQSFAATTGSASGWSATMKKSVDRARSTQLAVERFHLVAARFREVQIDSAPAWDFLDTYCTDLGPETLVYCDPPYPHETRGREGGHGYTHEMSDDDHRRLAKSLHALDTTVMISGYPSDLYDRELYPDWSRHEIAATATVGQTRADRRSRTEVIWANTELRTQGRLELFA